MILGRSVRKHNFGSIFDCFFFKVFVFFNDFWEPIWSQNRSPNPFDFLEPVCIDNRRKMRHSSKHRTRQIIEITAQAQCFSTFTFSIIFHRCCEAASKIHPKTIPKFKKKLSHIGPKSFPNRVCEPTSPRVSKKSHRMTQKLT